MTELSRRRPRSGVRSIGAASFALLVSLASMASLQTAVAYNYNYYQNNNNNNGGYGSYYYNKKYGNDDDGGDDGNAADDGANNYYADNDDGAYGDDLAGDDGNAGGDDFYGAGDDSMDDDYYNKQYQEDDDGYGKEKQQYQDKDDDVFHWSANVGFDGVSVMPLSCVNYNNGHMIKFQLFDTAQSYQCHFAEISTFVVSISHYMRAYFNYQALEQGENFKLPSDAAFLNCIPLSSSSNSLYGKIGCMERETFTSTKLQLRVYKDAQCSQPYDDGLSARRHANQGYKVGSKFFPSKVSFRPPFYSCLSCSPQEISDTFNKNNNNWYDDDYISSNGRKQDDDGGDEGDDAGNDDGDDGADDSVDDQYYVANDDVNGYGNRRLVADPAAVEAFEKSFWSEIRELKKERALDNYNVNNWNMCQRIYKYGVWCDEECRALDFFRTDQWSGSDIFLLAVMCTFLTAMILLIVAKRLKAQQKARVYGDDQPMPGLPPFGMALMFALTLVVIVTLAKLKFVNETLVFAVVTCILLFIYMLKLTLFENRRPVLLAAPRHDMFENPLDDHLFD